MNLFSYNFLGDKMKQKIIQAILVILLIMFSFYYTNKSIDLIRESDPIMRKIKSSKEKYNQEAVNATIEDDKIIPGISGTEIDYIESYKKMKQYGAYNESLTVFKETKPAVSVEDYYDKYITSGNKELKEVALIFKVDNNLDVSTVTNILLEKKVNATFFIDGLWLENNLDMVKAMQGFELEILSYDNRYEELYFSSSLNYLSSITGTNPKYCYADYDNKVVLELCNKLKLHTIIPTIKVSNFPYQEIKRKVESSSIISLPITSSTIIELPTVIDYLKQKGYSLVTLDKLLSESIEK